MSLEPEVKVMAPQSSAIVERDPNARPECFKSTLQELLFVLSVTMAVAMTSFLSGSLTVMSSFAGRDLNMTNAAISWMVAAPSLTAGALLLFFGSIADIFGRKSMFIGSMLLFSVTCVGAGFANSGLALDAICGVLGIWSASAVPAAQGILGTIYEKPSPRKNKAFASFSAGNPLGFAFGTIVSGVFTKVFNWRASFYLLAIVYFCVSIVAVFTVPKDTTPKQRLNMETIQKLDLPGTALAILGVGMFCSALSLGTEAGWQSPYVIVLLIVGFLLIVAFIIWEIKYPYAMIDMNVWRDRDFSLLLIILTCGFIAFSVCVFWLALYFQTELGFSALMTGVHMLPMIIVGILVNIVAGFIQHKVSNKLLMGIGASAYVISFTLAAVQRHGDSYWAFSFPALTICVIGADFEFVVANMYVLSSMPLSKQSVAGSLFQTLTRLGTAVGYGIATALFDSVKNHPSSKGYYANDTVEPFAAVCWFSAGFSFLGLCFVPSLKIGTQGHKGDMGRSVDVERGPRQDNERDAAVANEAHEEKKSKKSLDV